jgi:hypothetical protein
MRDFVGTNRFKRSIKILSFILVMNLVLGSLSFPISLGVFYYVTIILISVIVFFLAADEKKKINLEMILLILAVLFSIMVNEIPVFFVPYERFLMFFIIILLIGPLLFSKKLIYFRLSVFESFNKINIVICALSFLGLSTGIYRGITYSHFGGQRADFTGLYNHSMVLGPLAAIATISCLYYAYNITSKKKKYLLYVTSFLCFLSVVSAGSRSALLALFFGFLFFLYKAYGKNMIKTVTVLIFFSLILVSTYPLWQERTTFMFSKMDSGDVLDSRAAKWEQRIVEFNSSPIFGIGFASIDVTLGDDFDKEKGTIEPGSSWLAVLSMTGLLGFLIFFFMILKKILFVLNTSNDSLKLAYLGSILIIFIFHMFAEGYVFASGSLLFFFFWLVMGVIAGEKLSDRLIS